MRSTLRLRSPFSIPPPATVPMVLPREFRDGAAAPQPGLTPLQVPASDGGLLPYRATAETATLWWVGVHGWAGESTLSTLAADTRPAEHAWPVAATPGTVPRVVLLARTNYSGLIAAQRAATQWATDTTTNGIHLAGLALIADAPGRLPRALRELAEVITGGVPRTWYLPWIPAWRLGPVTPDFPLPAEFRELFTELSLTTRRPHTHS